MFTFEFQHSRSRLNRDQPQEYSRSFKYLKKFAGLNPVSRWKYVELLYFYLPILLFILLGSQLKIKISKIFRIKYSIKSTVKIVNSYYLDDAVKNKLLKSPRHSLPLSIFSLSSHKILSKKLPIIVMKTSLLWEYTYKPYLH